MAKITDSLHTADRRAFLISISTLAGGMALTSTPAAAWVTGSAKSTETIDVIVIGSGLSGVTAALQATESGAKTIIIDKARAQDRGGNSRVCLGSFLLPKDSSAEARTAFVDDVAAKSLGGGVKELYRLIADHIIDDVAWAESHGGQFEPWLRQAPSRIGVRIASPGQYQGMPRLLSALHTAFEKLGGVVAYDTKAKQLIVSDAGRVIGVRTQTRNGIKDYLARAVIIASGGYSANREMLEAAHPGGANILIRGRSWMTGDGIHMAREIGAGARGLAGVESLHLPVVCVTDKGRGSPTRALPYCLGINKEGQRFVDESLGYASFGKATLKQTEQTVALIFDDAMLKGEKQIGMSVEMFQKMGAGLHVANDVSELAGKIQVPAANLQATIDSFNAAVTNDGHAPGAVPAKNNLATPIGKNGSKLYAFYPLTPSITMVYGGLMVDASTRVLEADGRPIAGLYAAGEVVNLYYHDYFGGGILANCLTLGRTAGKAAAQQKT